VDFIASSQVRVVRKCPLYENSNDPNVETSPTSITSQYIYYVKSLKYNPERNPL